MEGYRAERRRFMGRVLPGFICLLGIVGALAQGTANGSQNDGPAHPPEERHASLHSEQPPTGSAGHSPGTPDLIKTGTRLFSATLVVIGLLALGAYGVRWLLNHRSALSRPGTMIRVVTTRSLGGRSSLAVVEIGAERFVIGVSPQRISFLTTLAGADNGDDGPLDSSAFERELQQTRRRGQAGS